MKKIFLLLLIPAAIFASSEKSATPFPNAKPGINILPLNEIQLPKSMKEEMIKSNFSLKGNSFNNTNSSDNEVNSLFDLARSASQEIKEFDNNTDTGDTHLRSTPSKIKLAFKFKSVPKVTERRTIGYAAAGGYEKGKGWDGIGEYFSDPILGICSFTTYQIQSAMLAKELTQYDVNGKPCDIHVLGNWNVGFLYVVNWYLPARYMSLQCANKIYDSSKINKVVELAKQIDKKY